MAPARLSDQQEGMQDAAMSMSMFQTSFERHAVCTSGRPCGQTLAACQHWSGQDAPHKALQSPKGKVPTGTCHLSVMQRKAQGCKTDKSLVL